MWAAEARAMRLAKERAKSKACSSLTGGIKSLSPEEQQRWAAQLFPQASSPRPIPREDVAMHPAAAQSSHDVNIGRAAAAAVGPANESDDIESQWGSIL